MEYYVPGERQLLPKEVPQKESTDDKVLIEDRPYQTVQLVCASIFLLCASTIPAWLTLGIQFMSPLVAMLGMLGAVTVYTMSWAAGRELKSETAMEKR